MMTLVEDDTPPEIEPPARAKRIFLIDVAIIGILGLAVQGFWSWQVSEPTYMDSYYYTTNGQRLATGNGFTEMVIWQYLDEPDGLPVPSHTYWMPLPSILAAAGYAIREDFKGTQILFWLLGGLLPVLTYIICTLLQGQRWQRWAAALFTIAGGYYSAFMGQPTTFAPFAWAGATCLLFTGLAISNRYFLFTSSAGSKRSSNWQWLLLLLSGATAGIAHLARADGLLLLVIAILAWLFQRRSNWEEEPTISSHSDNYTRTGKKSAAYLTMGLILVLSGYLIVMGAWLVRNWRVTGFPLPVGGTQSLFLTNYDDLFAYGREIDLRSFIDWGWGNIFMSKIQGLSISLQTYFAVVGLIFLMPFTIVGVAHVYRRNSLRSLLKPTLWYAIVLFIIMSLIFTFPGMRGSLFHSSVALWPWSMALAALGIGRTIDWVSLRLSHWNPEKAKPRFSAMFVLIAFLVSFVISWPRSQVGADSALFAEISDQLPEDAVVMAGNAPAIYYHTNRAAINVPNETPEILVEVAHRYGAQYLILDKDHPQPLADLYHGKENHPDIKLLGVFEDIRLYQLSES